MTPTPLVPSAIALEVAEELTRVAGRAMRAGERPIWSELERGGWIALADRQVPGGESLTLIDLALIAEVSGRFLLEVPFVETLVVRRSLHEPADSTGPMSYAVGGHAACIVPFKEFASSVAVGSQHGCELVAAGDLPDRAATDAFARSLPLTHVAAPASPLPLSMRQEIAILAAAVAIGAASEALAKATAYAKERVQFGRPIGSFQAIKHKLANMHCDLEMARSAIVWCCCEAAVTHRGCVSALDWSQRVCEDAIQVHGGIGFTWEAGVHRYLRHVMAARRVVVAALANS